MVRSIWQRTLVTTFAWAGLAWAQQPMSPPQPARPSTPAENAERQVTVQESGKPAQKCRVMKTWKTAEGAAAYQVQAVDTGEIMTIVESGPVTTVPGSREGTRKQAMATRIFHWGRDKTPPPSTPMPPGETTPAVTRTVQVPQPMVLPSPVSTTPMASAAIAKKPVEPAQSTNWRLSWGKADDHASTKVVKTPPPPSSARAPDTKPPDPLQIPDQYSRVAIPERPSTPKPDAGRPSAPSMPPEPSAMVQYSRVAIPERPSTPKPDADRPSAPSMPPEPSLMVPPSSDPPAGSHMVEQAIPVNSGQQIPLGTKSVMAAYEGDADAVRYIPVPIVTVPDVHRPPLPPMPPIPQPAQGRDSAGNAFVPAPVANGSGMMPTSSQRMVNAFTPAVPPEAMARSGNAFGPGNPMSAGVGMAGLPANNSMMPQAPPPAATSMAEAAPREMTPQTVQQMLIVLRDALYPSQRELAADNLAKVDWHSHPHVVQALLTAARQDPAATVRAGCIRCLAQMNVNTVRVVEVAQALRMDSDPRVRSEAEQAMIILAPAFSKPAVLPASTRNGP